MDVLRDQVIHAHLFPAVPDAVPVVANTGGVIIGDKMLQLGYVVRCSSEEMRTLFPELQNKIIPAVKLTNDAQSGAGQQLKQKPVGAERQASGAGRQTGGHYGNAGGIVPPPLMSVVTSTAAGGEGDGHGLMRDASQHKHCNNAAYIQ